MKKPTLYFIQTGMGSIYCPSGIHPLPFLSKKEQKEFDTIGYTGRNSNGERISFECFLNSLGKGTFTVEKTKYDNGDFVEEYTIARIDPNKNKSHIKFCVAYTLKTCDDRLESNYSNFEEKELALSFYENLLTKENLYTANFCEIIETTE